MSPIIKQSILAVVIVAVAAAVFFFLPKRGEELGNGEPVAWEEQRQEPSSGFRVGSNAIYMPEQSPGKRVTVGFAMLARPGFVVIHENANGKSGKILGSSVLLSAGEHNTLEPIALSREVNDSEELFAMLHQDDEDGFFDATKDDLVKDDSGTIIMMSFLVSADAEPPAGVSL